LICMVSDKSSKLHWFKFVFQFFSSLVIPIPGYFSLLWLVYITWFRNFGFLLRAPTQMHTLRLVRHSHFIVRYRSKMLFWANKFSNTGSEEILARQEAVELARRQMQEQYDKKAREHAIKQKEVCCLRLNAIYTALVFVYYICLPLSRKKNSCVKKNLKTWRNMEPS
jgi:hypothetical protein